jgi:hypothetical protein
LRFSSPKRSPQVPLAQRVRHVFSALLLNLTLQVAFRPKYVFVHTEPDFEHSALRFFSSGSRVLTFAKANDMLHRRPLTLSRLNPALLTSNTLAGSAIGSQYCGDTTCRRWGSVLAVLIAALFTGCWRNTRRSSWTSSPPCRSVSCRSATP